MSKRKFKIEKKTIVQMRWFETLYVIKDENNETIFTGNEELANRILKMLRAQSLKRKTIAMIKKKARRRK